MTNRATYALYRPNVVLIYGQSNAGTFGDYIESWPQRERFDPSVAWTTDYQADGGTTWGTLKMCENPVYSGAFCPGGKGTLGHSVAAEMRYLGLRPAIHIRWHGGATAAECYADMTTIAPMFAARLADVIQPRSVDLLWHQGEAEALVGTGAAWRSNTELSISAIRAAVGIPDLHVTIITLPLLYYPEREGGFPYRDEVRVAQQDLVSADENASLIDIGSVQTVDGIHWKQVSHAATARAFAAGVKLRLSESGY